MSQFEQLMAEIDALGQQNEQMTKALPADDGKDEKKIQAAAAEGGLGEGAAGGGGDAGAAGAGEGEGGEQVTKSFQLTLEDGTVIDAQDGTEMVKALGDRITASEEGMTKALGAAVALIKGQGDLLKSMQEQLAKLSGEGRGRKAVLSVVEKPQATPLVKSEQQGMSPDMFFAKALEAQKAGRISGMDISLAETCLNKGQPIPENIVQRVLA